MTLHYFSLREYASGVTPPCRFLLRSATRLAASVAIANECGNLSIVRRETR